MRVALGAAARALLRNLGIQVGSYVRSIGQADADEAADVSPQLFRRGRRGALAQLADATETRALTDVASARLVAAIQHAQGRRDTLGGVIEVVATGVPPGLGSHVQADRKLDGRLGAALLSIQAIEAVEVGEGIRGGRAFGSETHDPIVLAAGRLQRTRNHAGGLEGGVTNGEPLVLRAVMKPISTVPDALPSVHLGTLQAVPAHVERSDTCAVPAAGVVCEAMLCLALADAVLETLGGDTMDSLRHGFAAPSPLAADGAGQGVSRRSHGGRQDDGGRAARPGARAPLRSTWTPTSRPARCASVAQLFEREGEEGFREREALALAELEQGNPGWYTSPFLFILRVSLRERIHF